MPEGNTQAAPRPEREEPLFYLWHLERIGLLDPTKPDPTPPIWKDGLREIRVAIIDSGCTRRHPNLPKKAVEAALDVAVSPDGVVYLEGDQKAARRAWTRVEAELAPILATIADGSAKQRILDRVAKMARKEPRLLHVRNPATRFAAHGTACAGLVAGRTLQPKPAATAVDASAEETLVDDIVAGGDDDPPPLGQGAILPYFGVNPYVTIIPVATPFSHEIAPLVTALIHAVACEADVILMPRAVNDLKRPGGREAASLRSTRFDDDENLKADQAAFAHLLAAIATDRPVVLAAGNDGADAPAYPASLVNEATIGASDLIVAGAMNHLGLRASYSNGSYATGVTLYAPSDDEETANGKVLRLDPLRDHGAEVAAALPVITGETGSGYSPFGVLALDVPERLRADGSEDEGATLSRRELYGLFGGTSAASAIVAGVVSLMQAQSRRRLTGKQVKRRLVASRPPTEPPLDPPEAAGAEGLAPGDPLVAAAFFKVAELLSDTA